MSSYPPKSPPSLLSSSPNCHQLIDCCVWPGAGWGGRPLSSSSSSPPIAEGARHPATLSTSVDPVACFDSVAADEGNDDPSSLPWALSAPSSLVAPSADCCVARLLPLSSPSTASASSRHDIVAPSSVDCRVAPSSVGCCVAPSSVGCCVAPSSVCCRVARLLPSHLPQPPPPLHAMMLRHRLLIVASRRRRLIVASRGFSPLISLHRLRLFTP